MDFLLCELDFLVFALLLTVAVHGAFLTSYNPTKTIMSGKRKAKPSKKHGDGTMNWKTGSKDGRFLKQILTPGLNCMVSKGASLKLIKEMYPQFKKYKADSLSSAICRTKQETGFNVAPNENSDGMCLLLCQKFCVVFLKLTNVILSLIHI